MTERTVAGFKAWWPDEGETADDAICIEFPRGFLSWESERFRLAAIEAGKYDQSERDGWERDSNEHDVMILAVDEDDMPIGEAEPWTVYREFEPTFSAAPNTREAPDA